MASHIRGVSAMRRLLRELPKTVAGEIVVEFNLLGRQALAMMKAEAPHRTGATEGALTFKVFPKTLRLQVGFVGAAANRKFFYAKILDYGRKGGGRGVKRGSTKFSSGVGKIEGSRFVTKEQGWLRRNVNVNVIFDRALTKASLGGNFDAD